MELRRIRRPARGRNPYRAARLATVSRRFSRRRIAAGGRRTCGPSGESSDRDQGQRFDFLKRAHTASTNCALAGTGAYGWQVLLSEHCELERAQLRTQFIPASNSTLERHKSRDLVKDSGKTMAVSSKTVIADPLSKLAAQYGCGPVKFTGTEEALYERHLLFDNIVESSEVTLRERFEAVARSVRD